jgi:hypothetical protein
MPGGWRLPDDGRWACQQPARSLAHQRGCQGQGVELPEVPYAIAGCGGPCPHPAKGDIRALER